MNLIYKLIAKNAHKRLYGHRCIIKAALKYFEYDEFPSLKKDEFSFTSHFNDTIRGGIYYKDGYRDDVLVIFVHGNGGGHNAYTKEINYLTDHRFRVISFDVTGTNSSDGKEIRGFYQHPSDLNACISYLYTHPEFKHLPIYLVGHSWGGYTVLNAMNFANNDHVKKIISISGLRSMESIFIEHSPKKYHNAVKYMLDIEKNIYGKDVYFDACDYINKTNIDTLLIHSEDDHIVNYKNHFLKMIDCIEHNEHVKTISVKDHLHNPTYTVESVKKLTQYMNKCFSLKKKEDQIALKEKTDFNELTVLDENIMHEIINFLEN